MKRSRFLVIPLSFLLLILISGCPSSGGGGDDGDDIKLNDLVGSYNLQSFSVRWENGDTLDPSDVNSFSGILQINQDETITQTIEVNGFVSNAFATILSLSEKSIRISSGGCTFNLGIKLSGNTLTTTYPMGACGDDFTETDVWNKVNPASISSFDSNEQKTIDDDELQTTPGNIAGRIYEYLP